MIHGVLLSLLVLIMADFIIRFARLVKPIRSMAEKVTEESQRARFELAKIAEEMSFIRKALQKDSTQESVDAKT